MVKISFQWDFRGKMNAFLLVKSKVHIKVLLITLLIFVSCKAGPEDRNATTNARATEFTITRFLELAEEHELLLRP